MKSEMTKPEMVFDYEDGIIVIVHTEFDPPDAEWDEYLARLQEIAQRMTGTLVYTMGGGPSAKQRSKLAPILNRAGVSPPVAVMAHSTSKRAIITALSFFLRNPIRAFDLEHRTDAYEFLCLTPAQQESVSARLWQLCKQLGVPLATTESP